MSLSAFVLAAAATLLASKPYIDNEQMIQNEINVLPLDRPIALVSIIISSSILFSCKLNVVIIFLILCRMRCVLAIIIC